VRPEDSKKTFRSRRRRYMPSSDPNDDGRIDDQRDSIALAAQFIRMRLVQVNHHACDWRACFVQGVSHRPYSLHINSNSLLTRWSRVGEVQDKAEGIAGGQDGRFYGRRERYLDLNPTVLGGHLHLAQSGWDFLRRGKRRQQKYQADLSLYCLHRMSSPYSSRANTHVAIL